MLFLVFVRALIQQGWIDLKLKFSSDWKSVPYSFPGDYSEEVPPVPIPNTEVKLLCADDTALCGKVGRCQEFFLSPDSLLTFGAFFLVSFLL